MHRRIKKVNQRLGNVSLVLLVFHLQSSLAYCCSGEGAAAFTAENQGIVTRYGIVSLILVVSTTALYFVSRRKGLLATLVRLAVLFFHPLWWFGGGGAIAGWVWLLSQDILLRYWG